ncbi:hypothetical protein [Pseudomonas parafulva]|uniref:hypothetical protein n=1 Tax=Pseudomonas parafulva TaxID=157782 RepID=UPI00067F0888|nr:hypothetical protein [Pseudomonas parafulva]
MLVVRALALLLALSALGGCAFGQKIDYRESSPYIFAKSDASVEISVIDERPYILSASKSPTFVGRIRGLYYNPFNVNTVSGKPLSSDIQEALRRAFDRASIRSSDAYSPSRSAPGQRLLVLKVREWKMDAYMKVRFDYDISGLVIDENGREVATKSAKSSGPVADLISAGSDALSTVVNSEEIIGALSPSSPAKPSATPAPKAPANQAYDQCMRRVGKISDPTLRASSMSMCDDID